MYKGKYYSDVDYIKSKMKEMTYTPFEFLVLKLLIILIEIKLDSV